MPTLDWIGKRAVVNHHRELPYRLLHCDRDASAGEPNRLAVTLAALDAAVKAGAREVALFYPLGLAPRIDERLRERKFELLAEWWLPFNQ